MKAYPYKLYESYIRRAYKEIKYSERNYKVVDNTIYNSKGVPVIKVEQGILYYEMDIKELKRLLRI